jgi:hypothetical protein
VASSTGISIFDNGFAVGLRSCASAYQTHGHRSATRSLRRHGRLKTGRCGGTSLPVVITVRRFRTTSIPYGQPNRDASHRAGTAVGLPAGPSGSAAARIPAGQLGLRAECASRRGV